MDDQNIRSGTISALDAQARHPDRVNLSIDGEFALGLDGRIVLDQGLYVGQTLSAEEFLNLQTLEEISGATESALRLIAYRARSERELRQRLARNGFSANAIDQTIARMYEWHYLDDEDFARRWVESRGNHRPRSSSMIKRELSRKGVATDTVEQVVAEAEIDDFAVARELGRSWSGRRASDTADVQRRRLIGYLQRRGFGWDVIRRVLDDYFDQAEEEPE